MSDRSAETPTGSSAEPAEGRGGADVSRRMVLRGVAVGGAALPLLAACGGSESDGATGPVTGSGDSSGALASTADVPVGGGEILKQEKIVLTQPAKGDFKAFSAVCTHMQCVVAQISDGKIQCPCHGSQYSIEDGSVVGGPAPKPLPPIRIKVDGDQITRA